VVGFPSDEIEIRHGSHPLWVRWPDARRGASGLPAEGLSETMGRKQDIESLITKRITVEEAVDAFHHYYREKWIKVIVEPHRR
jgi:threonine dehydrogenase-like Zn-dependent dehydrogenase